jgi:hypothetical protein
VNGVLFNLLPISAGKVRLLWQRVKESPRRTFHLGSPKDVPQFVLGALQNLFLSLREILPGAIDVKIQHRHRGLIRRALASFASLGRTFQRQCNTTRIFPFKNVRLEIERVAALCDFSRPAALRGSRGPGCFLASVAHGFWNPGFNAQLSTFNVEFR